MCQKAGVSSLTSTLHKVISKLAVTIILLCKLHRGGGCVKPENCLGRKNFEQVVNVGQIFRAVQWDKTARFHAGPVMVQKD
jgi:hypothetical protein